MCGGTVLYAICLRLTGGFVELVLGELGGGRVLYGPCRVVLRRRCGALTGSVTGPCVVRGAFAWGLLHGV